MSGCDLGSPLPFFPSFIRSNEQRGCLGPPITASSPCPSGALMHLCVYNSSLWPGSKLSQEPCILGHGHCLQGRQAIKTNTEQISNLLFKFGWKNVLFPLPRQPRAGQGGRAAPWGPRPERRSVKQSWWQNRWFLGQKSLISRASSVAWIAKVAWVAFYYYYLKWKDSWLIPMANDSKLPLTDVIIT